MTAGHPHHLSGRLEEVTARPALPRAHPGGERLTAVALVGVTASGKSAAALAVAKRRGDTELVSVDSMCVYRGMDIGTSKPDAAARAAVPHHLLDLVDPDQEFAVTDFQAAAAPGPGRHRRPRPSRPARRRDRAVPARRGRRSRDPGPLPRGGGGARGRTRRGSGASRQICTPGWPRWTRWRRRGWSPATGAASSAPSR